MIQSERGEKFKGVRWIWAAVALIVAFFVVLYLNYYTPNRFVPTGPSGVPNGTTTVMPGYGTPNAGAVAAGQPGNYWFQTLNPDGGLSLAGRPFELTKAKVLEVAGNAGFWIGPTEPPANPRQQSLKLFVFRANANTPVKPGEFVMLIGVIEKLPSDPQAAWHVDRKTASELAAQKVYLRVTRIQPALE